MGRTVRQKTESEYQKLMNKELSFYTPLATELDIGMEIIEEAARLGLRNGLLRHRESNCRHRESGCIAGSVRHFCDRIIVKTCLMAVNEFEMEQAEDIILRLIEEN